MTQRAEKTALAQMNLVALTILLGAVPPVRLQGTKLLAVTFHARALAADITRNVDVRFSRLSNDMLHGQLRQSVAEDVRSF